MDSSGSARPMRADGRRNRQRVLDAAAALFAERGLRVQVEEVAQRAGVGVGTVCRNFPTKEALIETVLTRMYEELLEAVRGTLADDDAARGFTTFVTTVAEFQARHRVLAEEMATIEMPASTTQVKAALRGAVTEVVTRAQGAGAVRPDIGAADMSVLFAGIAHAAALVDVDPVQQERYVQIVLDGLRPADATPLPGRPLSFDERDRRVRRRQAVG